MMHRIPLLLSVIFAFAAPSLAQTAEEQARLDWVLQRGRLLFEIDRAAWVGTDDMLVQIPDAASVGMRGYLVEREGDGFAVIFFGGPPSTPVAFYRGVVENRQVVSRQVFPADARPALTPAQRRLADAREVIVRDVLRDLRFCARSSPNFAIIPPDAPGGPIDVYVLTPQEQANVFPFGGHNRVRVSAAGQVLERRRFTNSCVNMPVQDDRGNRPHALGVTHLLDPLPTEIHAFISIWSGFPVAVNIPETNRTWIIENGSIRIINLSGMQR